MTGLVPFALLLLSSTSTAYRHSNLTYQLPNALSSNSLSFQDRDPKCPPCFNCMLPSFNCQQFGKCNPYDGQCECPPGFGGVDCSLPTCGALADGKQRFPREAEECNCKDGWSGINCNVCETNKACEPLVPRESDALRSLDAGNQDSDYAVCYKGGYAVNTIQQMCDVTNRKILDMLPDRKPQVTFSCDRNAETCGFQFWIGQKESFYCGLSNCSVRADSTYDAFNTAYQCASIECACIPGRMLCGEDGSIDLTELLEEHIKGPASFTCTSKPGEKDVATDCKFSEPEMNNVINDVFADPYITLDCNAGECLRYDAVPGFVRPDKPDNNKLIAISVAASAIVVILACILFWYMGRDSESKSRQKRGQIYLDEDSDGSFSPMSSHTPSTLHFSDITYRLPNNREILHSISGNVAPGQLLAILGSSGAGKSTFLDIVAGKVKSGSISGNIYLNGEKVNDRRKYSKAVGFVDQEDTLLGTLTVYETVLYSALLRLPRDVSVEDKKRRTEETLRELGIQSIRDCRIGESGKRSISGGEKRRVSIACELVTSPSILFLDEPTSGLDAYNAVNVIASLQQLARNYNRTVVFTIHQPRSNIVSMFDKLLLLAKGRCVYSGSMASCQKHFQEIGWDCPSGFNIADYLLDLTMQDETPPIERDDITAPINDEESGLVATSTAGEDDLELRRTSLGSWARSQSIPFLRSKTSRASVATNRPLSPHLKELVEAFSKSDADKQNKDSLDHTLGTTPNNASQISVRKQELYEQSYGFERASLWTQFTILSGRAFKNLYRNPMLMLSHYVISIFVACICAFLFRNVTNDIPGFQNRMGLFFFVLALFGFSSLTSLSVFANERILFMRERSNGYYSPFTYFTAKILFDFLPLRLVPPLILGAIIYHPVGLVPTVAEFWKFLLVLILFNLVASSVVFFISILIAESSVANLVGSLVMLFNLLFAGLLINRDKVPAAVQWLQSLSFFHAAYEGLLVNEVRYLQMKQHKYGVDIEVPAATILSMFGFRAQAFWWPDVATLCAMFIVFTTLSFAALVAFVKEKR